MLGAVAVIMQGDAAARLDDTADGEEVARGGFGRVLDVGYSVADGFIADDAAGGVADAGGNGPGGGFHRSELVSGT